MNDKRLIRVMEELKPNEEYKAIIGAWERAIEAWNRRMSDER